MIRGFLYKRTIEPVVALISQGISPEKISLGMAWGIVLGVFPVLGSTTILCGLAAIILRLNLPAIQLVNYMVYPLQLVLLIPFFHLGDLIFQVEPLPLSAQELITMLRSDLWGTILAFWNTTLHAIVAWFLVSLPTFLILRYIFIRLIKTLSFAKVGAKR